MWQFIKAILGFSGKTPIIEINKKQGLKREVVDLAEEPEDQPQPQVQAKRQKGNNPPRSTAPQSPQALHEALLALQQQSHREGKILDIGHCSNILQPLVFSESQETENAEDAWLAEGTVEKYIEEKIRKSGQHMIKTCGFNPDSVKTKQLESFAKKNSGVTKIIWPFLDKKAKHFYLMMIGYETEKNQVYIGCVDGFNSTETQKKYRATASKLASLLYPDADLQLMATQLIVHQKNTIDCGVVACYFANHFIKKSVSEFETWIETAPAPSDNWAPYLPYRKKIAEVIYHAAVVEHKQSNASTPMLLAASNK